MLAKERQYHHSECINWPANYILDVYKQTFGDKKASLVNYFLQIINIP